MPEEKAPMPPQPTTTQLARRTLVLAGTNTADRTIFLPVPSADSDGNEWAIDASAIVGAFNILVKHVGGAGTSVTIANGKTAVVRTNTGGVKRQTADV